MAATRTGRIRGRLRVLVVDDDPLVRGLLNAVLQGARYSIVEAADGMQALRAATETPPDVVILDVMMPGLNGYDVCRAFRADTRLKDARIVMLTARDSRRDREESERAGADAFFTKPFSPLDLLDVITGPAKKAHSLAR